MESSAWIQLANEAAYILDLLASKPDRNDTDLLIVATGRIEAILNPVRLPFDSPHRQSFGGDSELCRGWRRIRRVVDAIIVALELQLVSEGKAVGWTVASEIELPRLPSPIPDEWITDLHHGVRIIRQRIPVAPPAENLDLTPVQDAIYRALTDEYQSAADIAAAAHVDPDNCRRELANLKSRLGLADHKPRIGYRRASARAL